jgi:uncharacterized membrane protein YczE
MTVNDRGNERMEKSTEFIDAPPIVVELGIHASPGWTADGARSPGGADREASHLSEPAVARWLRLLVGLWIFAAGLALTVRAELGLSSWDILHDAVAALTPLTFGQSVIALSVVVVAVGFALGVRPGPGTLANMLLVGAFTDGMVSSAILDDLASAPWAARGAGLAAGIAAIALGTAVYVGARLGAGPRDGLMLGMARVAHSTPGAARAGIEGSVLVVGVLLGGAVGIGTVAFAILIGPAINVAFRICGVETGTRRRRGGTPPIVREKGPMVSRTSKGDAWENCCSA